jgi:hypothetical protein
MKKRFQLSIVFLFLLSLFSCEDVLNKKNLENLVDDDLWADPVLLKGFMDNVMKDNLPWAGRSISITDEGYGQYDLNLPYDIININTGPSEIEQWYYSGIRNINMFLDNIDKCPESKLPQATKNDYIAQMKVLRAFKYFQMVRVYGGVPLILHAQTLEDDLYVRRAKTSECIAQIIKDIDEAIAMGDDFPMKRDDANGGRLNRATAIALKGRILLYYASPQFSKQTPAGTKDAATRWNEAYAANKAAYDQLSAAGFGLFRPNPASPAEAIANFKEMYSEDNEIGKNPELIWVRRYSYPARTSDFASNGAFSDETTIESANAFAKADGTPYTGINIPVAGVPGSSLAIENDPFWIDREPRFYNSILWNGREYPMYRTNAFENDKDANGKQIHWWKFSGGANAPFYQCERLDQMGLNICKLSYPEKYNETTSVTNTSGMDFPLLRFAEVMLNLAECAAKTNKEDEARNIIYQIRKRSGIPQGTNNYGIGSPSGEALILAILNERRIELFSEGFRWFDLRRWRLYTDPVNGYKLNGTMRHTLKARPKVEITPEVLATIDSANDPASYFAVFNNEIHAIDASPFSVGERQYFYRISFESHLRKNPNLAQTINWEDGTFNPYE